MTKYDLTCCFFRDTLTDHDGDDTSSIPSDEEGTYILALLGVGV